MNDVSQRLVVVSFQFSKRHSRYRNLGAFRYLLTVSRRTTSGLLNARERPAQATQRTDLLLDCCSLPVSILLVAGAILALVATATVKQNRRNLLARIRTEWGKPRDRVRKIDAIGVSHHSRLSASGSSASLDDRTWDDLNLDEVFAALDRTESTLGQHALYHRLRTAPIADHLDAFEALVTRMSDDLAAREQAQMALARLQDAHGYDLWWLHQPNALDTPVWHVIFPVVTACTLLALLLGVFWLHLLPIGLGALGVNVVVHYAGLITASVPRQEHFGNSRH